MTVELGQVFHRLVVVDWGFKPKDRPRQVECECACGNICFVRVADLTRNGGQWQKSCGCWRVDFGKQKKTHGLTRKIPEYNIWKTMHQRCSNPKAAKYKDYGGRGIKVCKRWFGFQHFLDDLGRRPSAELSLDRIDNDGDYEPGNVRWATAVEQANNRRRIKIA